MKNRWKAAFLILLGIVVAALATIVILAAIPPDGSKQKRIGVKEDGRVAFNIRTNKDDVNKLVNY